MACILRAEIAKVAGATMLSTTASYRLISADLPRSLERTAASPVVERSSAEYLERIVKVKSIDDFLNDDRAYAYAMKAFGLEEMTYAKAFMRKVLEEGIDDKQSFANQLSDSRYRDFAEAFNFARYGATTTVFTRAQQGTVDRYVRQTMEEQAGQENEGVRLALYFQRQAAGIESVMEILAEPALLKVVQVAFGLPPETSAMDIDKQAAMIEDRLDILDLQDAQKLDRFLTRFTSMWELEHQPQPYVPNLLVGRPLEAGLDANLLAALQNLRIGGI